MNDESEASALVGAIRAGDVAAVQKLLDEKPGLASSSLGGKAGSRTPLHIVTDWPGLVSSPTARGSCGCLSPRERTRTPGTRARDEKRRCTGLRAGTTLRWPVR